MLIHPFIALRVTCHNKRVLNSYLLCFSSLEGESPTSDSGQYQALQAQMDMWQAQLARNQTLIASQADAVAVAGPDVQVISLLYVTPVCFFSHYADL